MTEQERERVDAIRLDIPGLPPDDDVVFLIGLIDHSEAQLREAVEESYIPGWVKAVLMVSPKGEFHAIGGTREHGEGDRPYTGMERIKERIKIAEQAKSEAVEALRKYAHHGDCHYNEGVRWKQEHTGCVCVGAIIAKLEAK